MTVRRGNTDNGEVKLNLHPEEIPRREKRRLVQSHLTLAQIRHGQPPIVWSNLADCGDFFTVSIRLTSETSTVCFDGKTYRMSSKVGDARILYLPAVEFVDYPSSRRTLEMLLSRSFLNELADDLEAPRITRIGTEPCVSRDPFLTKFANLALPCFDIDSPINPLWADQFMWSFGTYVCATHGDLVTSRMKVGGLSRWQERLAKEVIDMTLVEGVRLTELAAMCGIRTSQFAHAFKRSVGVSPYEWLIRRRIERAKEEILRGVALSEVALSCGFADQSHMSRNFKRIVGTTPRSWQEIAGVRCSSVLSAPNEEAVLSNPGGPTFLRAPLD
jgi:AraC family transcriptional regulator